jgi:uncharacterized membrane protein
MPICKWPACVGLLAPTAIFLAGSVSADPMTTAVVTLTTAMVMRIALADRPATGRGIASLAICAIPVALCKSVYTPVVLLVMAVPARNWPGRWGRVWPVAIIGLSVDTMVAWSAAVHPLDAVMHGAVPGEQIAGVERHPVRFAAIAGRTVAGEWRGYVGGAIGLFGRSDIWLPRSVQFLYGAAMLWLLWMTGEPALTTLRVRLGAGLGVAGTAVLVVVSQYIFWTPAGASLVQGVQGRYFLPLLVPLFVVLRRSKGGAVRSAWVVVGMAALLTFSVVEVARR